MTTRRGYYISPQRLSLSDITTVLHDVRRMNTHESLVQTKSIHTCTADFPCKFIHSRRDILMRAKCLVFSPVFSARKRTRDLT